MIAVVDTEDLRIRKIRFDKRGHVAAVEFVTAANPGVVFEAKV